MEQQMFKQIDMISAFALIISVIAIILIIKTYINLNPNVEEESKLFAAVHQRLDRLSLDIANLQRENGPNSILQDIENLSALIEIFAMLQKSNDAKFAELANKVQDDILSLMRRIENKSIVESRE